MASNAYPPMNQYQQSAPTRRYQIREKIVSLGDNFRIKDESGQDVFTVRSKISSMSNKLILEDIAGNGLVNIRQELLHLHPTYLILSARSGEADRQLATVKQKNALPPHKFKIDSIYGAYGLENLDVAAHSFTLTRNGQTVAIVSKRFFSASDVCGVEIYDREDHAFVLALAMVVDLAVYAKMPPVIAFAFT